jgi:hypothetical protein
MLKIQSPLENEAETQSQAKHLLLLATPYCLLPTPCTSTPCTSGGAERDRTVDPLLAKQVLSQLSYSPLKFSKNERLFTGRFYGGPG